MPTTYPSSWEERAAASLRKHGAQISVDMLMDVLVDAQEPTAPTSRPDMTFVTEHLGLDPNDLDSTSVAQADAEIARARWEADRAARENAYTTQQVADLLNMAPANVRRAAIDGSMYSFKPDANGQHLFPRWQFPGGRRLPGLRDVIAALEDEHPIDVERFMTTPDEALRERSPVDWLAGGGSVRMVARLADELAWV